jgi:hypothetical protein
MDGAMSMTPGRYEAQISEHNAESSFARILLLSTSKPVTRNAVVEVLDAVDIPSAVIGHDRHDSDENQKYSF